MFIHGIGIGLYPYTNFLSELNSISGVESGDPEDQVGIIAIEIMPVSFRITHSALGRAEMCSEIEKILLEHLSPGQKCVLVSHSYGTVISTHLLTTPSTAGLIGPVVLIDPVTILLHLPDVAYNFTRRQPQKANEHQLYYFASMDMGVSHTLGRHFFWNENVLWKKDLKGRRVTVSLSGMDLIVDTEAVGRYLSDDSRVERGNGHISEPLMNLEGHDEHKQSTVGNQGNSGHSAGSDDANGNDNAVLDQEKWKSRSWCGTGIEVLWFKDLDHAQVFDKQSTRQRLINVISAYCNDG